MTEVFAFLITLVVILFYTAVALLGVLVVVGIVVGIAILVMVVIGRLK